MAVITFLGICTLMALLVGARGFYEEYKDRHPRKTA